MTVRDVGRAFVTAFQEWRSDKAQRLSAALAFYTVLSLSPLLIIVIAVAGRVFGAEAVRGEIVAQFGSLIGHSAAEQIEIMIQQASNPKTNLIASLLGLVTLLLGSAGVFGQLKDALDTVWSAKPSRYTGFRGYFRSYMLSMMMVLGVAFLLLISLVLSAGISGLGKWAADLLPSSVIALRVAEFLLTFVVITVLFAMIYKILPEVDLAWRDVWVGAAVTALLFNIGKLAIGVYLGRSSVGSVFGAAGSLVIILVWTYYSAAIFLYGAELTEVFARNWGTQAHSPASGFAPAPRSERPPAQA